MGRSVNNFRHSTMVVYMVLKLSSVGGTMSIHDWQGPDDKPLHVRLAVD